MIPPSDLRLLNFVQAIDPLRGGGLGAAALQLSDWCRREGITSKLVTTSADSSLNQAHRLAVGKAMFPQKFFFSPELRRIAKKLVEDCDQVHGHGFYTYLNWLFGSLASKQKKPLCLHVHGIFDPYILKRSRLKKQAVKLLFENANFRYTKLWRAITPKEADQIKALGITSRIEILPNGIDLELLRISEKNSLRTDFYSSHGRQVMLFLGRIHPKKGLNLLIQAFAEHRQLAKDWMLAVVGPDENNYQSILIDQIDRLGLNDSVKFFGSVIGERKLQALASADAFALTSLSEGMPVAVLEAAAFTLPLLISTECNISDFEGDGGAIVCRPDQESVSQALQSFLAMGDAERQSRGLRSHQIATEKFLWPSIAKDWVDICKSI